MSFCLKCHKILGLSPIKYGLHEACFVEWFGCQASDRFRGLTPRKTEDQQELKIARSSFFHGKFKKYTAELAGKKYILKIAEADFPNLPRVEFVCNQIARLIGIKVPDFYLVKIEEYHLDAINNTDTFVSENFFAGSSWKKLTHLYHFLKSDTEMDVESVRKILFDLTKNPKDVLMYEQTLLFDSLIGNDDRHGRNLAILSRGKINRLAPIYDNPSHIGVETLLNADLNPCGKIFTKHSHEPSMKDYVKEFKRLKLNEALFSFRKHCQLGKIISLVEVSLMGPQVTQAMTRLIKKRYEEFENNI